ncbi:MAG TPA: FadR/GntR family transcriptional regulator [Candidatus Dormibacteraeota bacterium]|nr:FadR/GntR family transcriptional regulator [Candidatus Dormibacteraeota bacterium]
MAPDPNEPQPGPFDYLQHVRREERLADKVADMLKKAIVAGQFRPGDRLPPERVLGDRFGVSRTVIREAIRGLTAKGLVEVRSGSGSVVARVEPGAVAEAVQLYMQGAGLETRSIGEVRTALEVHAAGLAAERATEEDLHGLRDAVGPAHDAEFHRRVARATQNPLLVVLLEAIAEPAPAGAGATMVLAHERIVDRIASRDHDGAREAMRAHLADSPQVWAELMAAAPPEATAEAAEPEPAW